ncbi:MBL fold metallo-hydrolase [Clostridium chromiireducens]|uniref:MBL fold metallo-hydrolase n=1 Tax=Clostridium chromiireducens TaxID=225345 RepID=A0A964RNB9_9CLOT|nr:MBL fold metallo-hydrolase [Clostridium chromiireducens]MVX64817.1 MBL fold metallo-hydrolase [Clostridium chromiireducens]
MNKITIDMFPAKNGDAFLIRLDNKRNILIDMGYDDTYRDYIKDKLIEIKNEKQCIDLLVITHIDEDHIEGAIEFLKENGDSNMPNIIEIKEVWYNSYRHLQFDKMKVNNISLFENRKLEEIKLSNSGGSKKEVSEASPVSAEQGSTLAGYLYGLGYDVNRRWNSSFNYESVNLDNRNEVSLGDIKIYILSPNTKKLNRLSELWTKKLHEIDIDFCISDEKIFDDAYEMYMKKLKQIIDIDEDMDIAHDMKEFEKLVQGEIKQKRKDRSDSNGASISFILEYKEKKLLFLGDAHEDIIMENLNEYMNLGNSLEFDVVKISHHGSIKNNFKWIEAIKSKKYLISTNGKRHGHPNDEVIARILQCNDNDKFFYFNYPLDTAKSLNNIKLKEKYKFSLVVGDGTSNVQIKVGDK